MTVMISAEYSGKSSVRIADNLYFVFLLLFVILPSSSFSRSKNPCCLERLKVMPMSTVSD